MARTRKDIELAKKALAEYEIRSAEQARTRLQEQHDAGARWLLASLFAINAGAVVALIGADRISDSAAIGPVSVYLLGVIFSFAMGTAVQISDRRMVTAVHGWGQYWSTFVEVGDLGDGAEEAARAKIDAAEKIGRLGRKFGLLSMLSWIVASVWVLIAIGLK